MALRQKLASRTEQYLEPGERVEAIFIAQGGMNPWLVSLTIAAGVIPYLVLMMTVVTFRIVMVTDRSILVVEASRLSGAKPKRLLARLPRGNRIGPVTGIFAKLIVGPEQMWVHKRFHSDVRQADAALTARIGNGVPTDQAGSPVV